MDSVARLAYYQDMKTIRMGQVGEPRREYVVEPLPESDPIPEAVPETNPELVPA